MKKPIEIESSKTKVSTKNNNKPDTNELVLYFCFFKYSENSSLFI